ncbi:MAG TPA: ABC transporter ATP-binding protein [Candidatus Saccharimonadales bacterium]|nr:ABC transporter ATP-binding protein [Candidatus Saccharimonadales bacterium]
MSAPLRLAGLEKRFPNGTVAIDHLDLDVAAGELVALLGPSGCGKTTTLRCIAGFEDPTAGTIELGGSRIDTLPPNRRGATMVFQGYALFPHLSVAENVGYGLRVRHIRGAAFRDRVGTALALVGLDGLGERRPHQLSGGQQQRVALARALILEPALLLFDEPLSNLDAKLREHMRLEIRGLQQRVGITSVYVTHDQAEAMTLADRVAVMDQGRIAQLGSPREIYDEPVDRFVAEFVGTANFLSGTVRGREQGLVVVDVLGAPRRASAAPGAFAAGAAVLVMVRPEEVRLAEGGGSGTTPATVVRAGFVGAGAIYQLRTAAGELLLATTPMERGVALHPEGASVGVRVRDGALRVFPPA